MESKVDIPLLGPPEELARGDFEMIVRRLADDLAFGTDDSRYVGSGIEYAQSRPYVPGDTIKQMDWRVSARTGELFVKEYESLKRMPTYLLVDASASMSVASTTLTKRGLATWLAAALGVLAHRRLSPVSVTCGGVRDDEHRPSLHRTDLWRSLEELRHHDPGSEQPLAERLRRIGLEADRASVVVVLSDLRDPEAVEATRLVSQRHDTLALQIEDPAERGHLRAGFLRGVEAETGRTFVATGRTRWFEDSGAIGVELARGGVDHVLLGTDQNFLAPLKHFLSHRGGLR